jgi:hypothetical protein
MIRATKNCMIRATKNSMINATKESSMIRATKESSMIRAAKESASSSEERAAAKKRMTRCIVEGVIGCCGGCGEDAWLIARIGLIGVVIVVGRGRE